MILEVRNVHKRLPSPDGTSIQILNDINFSIEAGSMTAIVGPSGSGKTTLLGLCAGLDTPTGGSIFVNGKNLSELQEDQRTLLRRESMGFVFQNFQLIPNLSALENVMLPLELQGTIPSTAIETEAKRCLDMVELGHRASHYPLQLSGGEQQRVALARAIIHKPQILFADEPTGNLDTVTGEKISSLLFSLHQHHGMTTVIVTHNHELASRAQRVLSMKGGCIV